MERTEDKVLENTGLIHYVLQKQLHVPVTHTDYEDLYQQGVIGLILAIDRFDTSKELKFATFAVPYIRGIIQQYKRDFTLPVHCSRNIKDAIFKVSKGTSNGLSLEEIEHITELTHSDINDALCILGIQSFQQELTEGILLGDMVPCSDAYEEFLSRENIDKCIQAVSSTIVNPQHRALWLDFIHHARQGDIIRQQTLGAKYNMSQAQVSRILKRYNEHFRKLLE